MIVAFYSYKGGVGRSMALANIAELLYREGYSIVLIDWDLEAPGIERYFVEDVAPILDKPGVIDMLGAYKNWLSRPDPRSSVDTKRPFGVDLNDYVVSLREPSDKGGRLWLLPAGRRTDFPSYAAAIHAFDWNDFYANWEGEIFFEWFRRAIAERGSLVFLDSRTGATEMGGVCTFHLADLVVMFCATNEQNLGGSFNMAQRYLDPGLKSTRGGRELGVIVVPTRLERAEGDQLTLFETAFRARFGDVLRDRLGVDVESYLALGVPYVPYYAYRERLAVVDRALAKAKDLVAAFDRLLQEIATWATAHGKTEFERLAADFSSAEQQGRRAAAFLRRLASPDQVDLVRRVVLRLVRIGDADVGVADAPVTIAMSEVDPAAAPIVEALIAEGLVARSVPSSSGPGDDRLQFAHASIIEGWPQLTAWIAEDRDFLIFRQATREGAREWKRNPRALLTGRALDQVEKWTARWPDLNERERQFIERSREEEARRIAAGPKPLVWWQQWYALAGAAAVVVLLVGGGWLTYSRTDQSQLSNLIDDGAAENPDYTDGSLLEWVSALAGTRRFDQALASARQLDSPDRRAVAIAIVAAGMPEGEQGDRVADEASRTALVESGTNSARAASVLAEIAGVLRQRAATVDPPPAALNAANQAVEAASKVPESDAQGQALFGVSDSLLAIGLCAPAQRAASSAASQTPLTDIAAVTDVAKLLARVSMTDQALALVSRLPDAGDVRLHALAELATTLADSGKAVETRSVAKTILARVTTPEEAMILADIAEALALIGAGQEAFTIASRIKDAQWARDALWRVAQASLDRNDLGSAREALTTLSLRTERSRDLRYPATFSNVELATLLATAGDAKTALRLAAEEPPDVRRPTLVNIAGRLADTGQLDDARAALDQMLTLTSAGQSNPEAVIADLTAAIAVALRVSAPQAVERATTGAVGLASELDEPRSRAAALLAIAASLRSDTATSARVGRSALTALGQEKDPGDVLSVLVGFADEIVAVGIVDDAVAVAGRASLADEALLEVMIEFADALVMAQQPARAAAVLRERALPVVAKLQGGDSVSRMLAHLAATLVRAGGSLYESRPLLTRASANDRLSASAVILIEYYRRQGGALPVAPEDGGSNERRTGC